METRKDIAAEKKRCGSHNCTQAVLCTYHDFAGIEEETIKNVGNAFAAGLPFIHIFDNSQHLTFAEEIVKSCFESCISWT